MQFDSTSRAIPPSKGAGADNVNVASGAARGATSAVLGAVKQSSAQTNYTVQEAATYLRVCEKTVRNLISRKLLRTSKVLRHIRIPGEDVENLFASTC